MILIAKPSFFLSLVLTIAKIPNEIQLFLSLWERRVPQNSFPLTHPVALPTSITTLQSNKGEQA